jgi:hypothetical protein
MIHKSLTYLIILIHTLLVLFIVLTPFIGDNKLCIIHCMIVPSILLHWLLNNNTCILVLIELYLKKGTMFVQNKKNREDCFTCQILDPVFEVNNKMMYLGMILLFSISSFRVYSIIYKNT